LYRWPRHGLQSSPALAPLRQLYRSVRRLWQDRRTLRQLRKQVLDAGDRVRVIIGARNCHALLKPGGHFRVAVPDGLHPDPAYIEYARPGGSGEGIGDHKAFYIYRSLGQLLESAGFEVRLLEWFDENGAFHAVDWDPGAGYVDRSTRFDDRNRENPIAYTSLIADAVKQTG
jgi:predicted SAM-dependent methyltransferase